MKLLIDIKTEKDIKPLLGILLEDRDIKFELKYSEGKIQLVISSDVTMSYDGIVLSRVRKDWLIMVAEIAIDKKLGTIMDGEKTVSEVRKITMDSWTDKGNSTFHIKNL